MTRIHAPLVVETRVDIRVLAALFQYYAATGIAPRTRSELVRFAIEDCARQFKLQPVASTALAQHILSSMGVWKPSPGVIENVVEERLADALESFEDGGKKDESGE